MKYRFLIGAPFVLGLALGTLSTGLAATLLGSAVFSDVPAGSFYDAAVGDMYNVGVIKGFEDGKFHPDEAVTRAQVAVMMQRLRNEILGIDPSGSSSSRSSRSSSSRSSTSAASSSSSLTDIPDEGALEFSVSTVSYPESAKAASVVVRRIGGDEGDVTVKYATQDTTATGGSDYTVSNGTLTFRNGEISKTISVSLKDDTTAEGLETFKVILSSPTGGAILGNSTMTVNVLDNEASNSTSSSSTSSGNSSSSSTSSNSSSVNVNGTMVFAASGYSVDENLGSVTITVNRSGGSNGAVNVNYATVAGSAGSSEFAATNGTLSFAAGETSKTFTITIMDDSNIDGDKNFTVNLSSPTGGANIGTPGTATVSLVDNENLTTGSGSFKFSTATYRVTEGSTAVITVQRVGGTKGNASVNYNIGAGSAVPGLDFTQTTGGTLTFVPGEYSKVILLNTFDDTNNESEEVAYLTLTSPSGATLGSITSATLYINE